MTLYLDKRLCDMPELSNHALACYCAMLMSASGSNGTTALISTEILSYHLLGRINPPRRFADKIKDGIRELEKKNIISIIESFNGYYIIDYSNYSSEYTIELHYEEIRKIFSLNETDKFTLLRYFITLICSFKSSLIISVNGAPPKDRAAGTYTSRKLSEISGISESTIIKYNKILEENNLIYMIHTTTFIVNKNGRVSHLPNIYGRASSKAAVDEYAKQYEKLVKAYDWKEYVNIGSNEKRRLSLMYNRIAKGRDDGYTPTDIAAVYAHVVAENKRIKKIRARNPRKHCNSKIRDLDVFNKYDFIKFVDIKK